MEKASRYKTDGEGRQFNVVGLFAGIGGIELGLSSAGHRAHLLCELDRGAQAVLRHRFPDVEVHDDVSTLKDLPAGTDLVSAGFPCQDLSQAGQTRGISGKQSGLVGEVFRLLRRRPVPWLVLENVPFMLQLGRGRALEVIVRELEELGYAWAYRVVDTLAFGLPQRRERVFLVASLEGDPRNVLFVDEKEKPVPSPFDDDGHLAKGFYWTEGIRGLGWAVDAVPTLKGGSTVGIPSPPGILLPNGDVVTPDIRDAERLQGFRANWTLPAEEVCRPGHRWKLVGNAVTVNVAAWVGKRLAHPGRYTSWEHGPLGNGGTWPYAAWNIGDRRHAQRISTWPVRRRSKPLHEFLSYAPKKLSVRATSGFLKRAATSRLRRLTSGDFTEKVTRHLERMQQAVEGASL